jgi:hypothetical protein
MLANWRRRSREDKATVEMAEAAGRTDADRHGFGDDGGDEGSR